MATLLPQCIKGPTVYEPVTDSTPYMVFLLFFSAFLGHKTNWWILLFVLLYDSPLGSNYHSCSVYFASAVLQAAGIISMPESKQVFSACLFVLYLMGLARCKHLPSVSCLCFLPALPSFPCQYPGDASVWLQVWIWEEERWHSARQEELWLSSLGHSDRLPGEHMPLFSPLPFTLLNNSLRYGQFSCSFTPDFTVCWGSKNLTAVWPEGTRVHLPSGNFLCDQTVPGEVPSSSRLPASLVPTEPFLIQKPRRQFPPE